MSDAVKKLDEQILEIDRQRAILFEQITPLQEQLVKLSEQRTFLVKEASSLKVADILMSSERNWPQLLDSRDDTLYDAFQRVLEPYTCIYPMGYYPSTNQRAFELKFGRENIVEVKMAEDFLNMLLPHILAHEKNTIHIPIFEHTCSEHGRYYLSIDANNFNHVELYVCRYSRESKLQSFNTLNSALKYVQTHHYYSTTKPDNDVPDMDY